MIESKEPATADLEMPTIGQDHLLENFFNS